MGDIVHMHPKPATHRTANPLRLERSKPSASLREEMRRTEIIVRLSDLCREQGRLHSVLKCRVASNAARTPISDRSWRVEAVDMDDVLHALTPYFHSSDVDAFSDLVEEGLTRWLSAIDARHRFSVVGRS